MSPLQLFLLHYESDPSGSIPLVEFLQNYFGSLNGTETTKWRDVPHVVDVLARSGFVVKIGNGNRRFISGLVVKTVAAPALVGSPLMEATQCQR